MRFTSGKGTMNQTFLAIAVSFVVALFAAATNAEAERDADFGQGIHVDAEIAAVEGDVWSIALIARDATGAELHDAEPEISLRLNKSAKGEILGPNIVRLEKGRALVKVRKLSPEGNTVLVPKPTNASIGANECWLRSYAEHPGVWVRDENGGVPREVPEDDTEATLRVLAETDHDFNWFDDPAKPLTLRVAVSNKTEAVRDVRMAVRIRDWDGSLVADETRMIRLFPHGAVSEIVTFEPHEERGLYFAEASATDSETGEEAFTRTNLVRLPPHEFRSTPDDSIFGIAATWLDPTPEKVQRVLDRLGVRWMRMADGRVQHAGRAANFHNNLSDWDNADWPEEEKERWAAGELRQCVVRGNRAYEFGNEMNLRGLEIGRTMDGIGNPERADVYSKWVKAFRRTMKERGFEGRVRLLGFGMAGFDLPFARAIRDSGALACLDGFCLHAANSQFAPDYPYGTPSAGRIERPRGSHPAEYHVPGYFWNFFGTVRSCRDFLDANGGIPLWVTEVYSSTWPNYEYGASMRDSADNVVLEYALLASEGVKAGMFYQLHDGVGGDRFGLKPSDREYSFGLLNRDLSFKPAAMGYCAIAEALDRATFRGWMKLVDEQAHGMLFDTPRGPVAVMWGRWDGLWLTVKPPFGPCVHKEPWIDRWPTKKRVTLPASPDGRVSRIDSIGRARCVENAGGMVQIVLDGSPCIVYGLDAAKIELW